MACRLLQQHNESLETKAFKFGGNMNLKNTIRMTALGIAIASSVSCAGGPMTTREKGAGIGALGGAAAGGLIGTAFGRPGTGAAVGAGVGLGAGALVGDYMQGREIEQ
jgi:outer membrane protein with glycine zipper